MTGGADDVHTLTGAYALDALDDDERAAFEKHMARCETCALEVREFSATAGRLALAASSPAPEHLKSEVLRQIGQVRQDSPGAQRVESRSPRRSGKTLQWALAAGLAGVVALGATTAWQYRQAEDARQQTQAAQAQSDQIAAVLASPDAKVTSTSVDGGGRGSVVVSQDSDKAVFVASGLTLPPKGKVYQLWFADGGQMRSAGLMDASRTDQSVLMDGSLGQATGIGVTLEPAGGSPQPTADPVAAVQVPA